MQAIFVSLHAVVQLMVLSLHQSTPLDAELGELSGWCFVNDSTLVAHNDGGNESCLYMLNLNGEIQKKIALNGVKNTDFEDIAFDGKNHLYLADFGNNLNNRKNLVIHKIVLQDVLHQQQVNTEQITYHYPEQTQFPPLSSDLNYDAEALVFKNDSLWIFTKCRTKPFSGKSHIYALPTQPGNYAAKWMGSIVLQHQRDWYRDAVTGADIKDNTLYLLTYNRVEVYDWNKNLPKFLSSYDLPLSQMEAIAAFSSTTLWIGNEDQFFSKGKRTILQLQSK